MRDLPRYWIAGDRRRQQQQVVMMIMVIRRYLPIYRGLCESLRKFDDRLRFRDIEGGLAFLSAVDRWVGYLEYLI